MAGQTYAEIQKRLQLRSKALAANIDEVAHLEVPWKQLDSVLEQVEVLTTQQANLTASKQEVSKQIAELLRQVLAAEKRRANLVKPAPNRHPEW